MYVHAFQGELQAGACSDAISYFRLSVAPALRQQPGFVNARLLCQRQGQQCLLLLLWESAADQSAADQHRMLRTLLGQFLHYFKTPPTETDYELSVQVG